MGNMNISRPTIKGFFKKNEQDFNEIYSQSFRLLKHIALSILHDDMEADGVVTDTYIKALENPSSFSKGSF
jgi:DNA-directed RNA polymerase specialized sigma24 family protein